MPNKEIIDYIEKESSASKEKVVHDLLNNGWKLNEIEEAFALSADHDSLITKRAPSESLMIPLLNISIVLCLLLFVFVLRAISLIIFDDSNNFYHLMNTFADYLFVFSIFILIYNMYIKIKHGVTLGSKLVKHRKRAVILIVLTICLIALSIILMPYALAHLA